MVVYARMADLRALGDAIDICLARSEAVLEEDDWRDLVELRSMVRTREGFLGEVLVVALAGGTGSGKSSLLNTLCGAQVARVGIERPTTSRSLAAVPTDIEGDIVSFVDALGIDEVVEARRLDRTVFVDLPDFDSTFLDHRSIVESVLSVVDAIVWVLDPEKYADIVIHEEFIEPLSAHQDQMLFVINKADRLGTSARAVVESLRIHLVAEGYRAPQIVTTVAAASESTDLDVEDLSAALEARFDRKRSAEARIGSAVGAEANRLWKVMADQPDGSRTPESALVMASLASLGVAAAEIRHARTERTGR